MRATPLQESVQHQFRSACDTNLEVQRNSDKYNKIWKNLNKLKMKLVVCVVWHISMLNFIFRLSIKKRSLDFDYIFQKVSWIPATVTVTVNVTVTIRFEVHRLSGGVSKYIETAIRSLSKKLICNFFLGGLVLLGMFWGHVCGEIIFFGQNITMYN